MKKLGEKSQTILDDILGGYGRDQKSALAALAALSDEEQKDVETSLLERLDKEDGPTRSWIISALTTIRTPKAMKAVAEHINPETEEYEWTRYWAIVGVAQLQLPDLEKHLSKAVDDPDDLIKALSLAFLIEVGFEDTYLEPLLDMARTQDWYCKWAVGKAIRQVSSLRPFRQGLEAEFIHILQDHLDIGEWRDVQYQAAQALGNMTHRWRECVEILHIALQRNFPDVTRRACVRALAHIGKPEIKDALLLALTDEDAEIRVQAANALQEALTAPGAVSFVIDRILAQQKPPGEYFDALRQINRKEATSVLTNYLMHPDPDIADRASHALTTLGGEEAIRSLQAQRQVAINTYTELLAKADQEIIGQFNTLISQAQKGFWLSITMHGIIFIAGLVILGFGLYVAVAGGFETFERWIGAGAAASSLITIVAMFYTGPIQNIQKSVTDLVEVNVIFLGYVRQLNQIDATFKQLFLSSSEFGIEQMEKTVTQIQSTVEKTMEQVHTYARTGKKQHQQQSSDQDDK